MTYINMVGEKYGRLLVVERLPNYITMDKRQYVMYSCKCDCGVVKKVLSASLRRGKVKSCGCLLKESVRERPRLPPGESSFRDLFRSYKNHAKQLNLPFELDMDFFRDITKQDCFYCGVNPLQIWRASKSATTYIYNGLDRVNNGVGYIDNNVVPSCHKCNQAKRAMTFDEFINWAKRLSNNITAKRY